MEKKNRGTFKVNPNLTPKENVVALLKLTFPIETTIAKMDNSLEAKNDNEPYYRRGQDSFTLNNVTAYPSARNRWSDCTKIKDFQRVVFSTRTSRKETYNRRIMRSVPVVKGKISLTKVTRLLTDFAKCYDEYVKEQEAEKIEQEKREALRNENEKRLVDLRNAIKLPSIASLGYSGYREEANKKFDLDIRGLKEAQVVVIAQAIKEALKKHKIADADAEGG